MNDASFWQSIAETPWWVYAFIGYAIYACYLATRPRELHIKAFYLLPLSLIFLTCMSIGALAQKINMNHFMMWANMVLLGTGLSYLHFQAVKVKALKNEYILAIPGTYLPIAALLVSALLKFYFQISLPTSQSFFFHEENLTPLLTSYGFLTGVFIGRLGYALRCVKEGPFHATAS